MRDTAAALAWIVALLTGRGVPFQVVGGLAARAYGATREVHDLDFYIPTASFRMIDDAIAPYLSRTPSHYRHAAWDVIFAQLVFAGQKIELGGAEGARFYDRSTETWIEQRIDFGRCEWREVFGTVIPVMPKEELIAYKSALDRPVDRRDLAELLRS